MQVEKKTVKRGTRKKAVRHRWSGTVVPKQGLSHGQAGRNQLLPGFSGANVVRQPHTSLTCHCLTLTATRTNVHAHRRLHGPTP
jgi:hypothetical protein